MQRENDFNGCLLFPRADLIWRAFLSEDESDSVYDDGFSGSRLSREDSESVLQREFNLFNRGEIFYMERSYHLCGFNAERMIGTRARSMLIRPYPRLLSLPSRVAEFTSSAV